MAWKDITETEEQWIYTGYNYKDRLYVMLQYDDDSVTTTKVTVRFELRRTTTYRYYDGFGVLLNPVDANGKMSDDIVFLKLKDATYESTKWPADNYKSKSFTLTKKYNDAKFTLPPFWFINTWAIGSAVQTAAKNEDVKATFDYHNKGGAAVNYKTVFDSSTWAVEAKTSVATNGTAPSLTLKDNKNNTVTISGALGKNGDNNKIESAALYYTTDGSDPSDSDNDKRTKISLTATSGASYSQTVTITKKCTVRAYIKCKFKYNNTSASGKVSDVIYYAAPSRPGKPTLSYNKSRLTIKEPWKISWATSTAANTDSPVVGYRFRVYKKAAGASSFSTIKFYSKTSGELLSDDSGSGEHRYYYDRKADKEIPMSFYPDIQGIVPGDTIRFGLYAYAKNGAGTRLFSAEPQVFSDDFVVQNAGVVHTKVSGTWKEGQVFVKVDGAWQEAETVNVKVNGAWHESE